MHASEHNRLKQICNYSLTLIVKCSIVRLSERKTKQRTLWKSQQNTQANAPLAVKESTVAIACNGLIVSTPPPPEVMKTETPSEVGQHVFTRAGLGQAPFKFTGLRDNLITYPDGSSKPGGSCDYCGTSIRTECWLLSADGRKFKVGCDCIRKSGDEGLLRAYKTSPAVRQRAREIQASKNAAVLAELTAFIAANSAAMAKLPHPQGFTDRTTGKPLSLLDQAEWLFRNCGASGRASTLRMLKNTVFPF